MKPRGSKPANRSTGSNRVKTTRRRLTPRFLVPQCLRRSNSIHRSNTNFRTSKAFVNPISMPLPSPSRFISLTVRHVVTAARIATFTTSISTTSNAASAAAVAAETYYAQLHKKDGNLEMSLSRIPAKLDAFCVSKVLNRCFANHSSLLGLRFFIWAGLRSDYRHSGYMYTKGLDFLKIEDNPEIIQRLFEMYEKEGCVVSARMVRVVLNLCKEGKLVDESLRVLRKMVSFGCRPDTVMYNVVIKLFCEAGRIEEADALVKEMESVGVFPDMITFSLMIKAFCDAERNEDACGLFKVMKERGCRPNVAVYSQLLDKVCKFGSLERALELLEAMENEEGDCKPNVVTYTSVIQAFCERGRPVEALSVLDRMVSYGCLPNRVTVILFNKRFCEEGLLEEAVKVTEKVVAVGTASAQDCYSSLVISMFQAGYVDEAEIAFKRMLNTGLKPGGVACSFVIKQMCLKDRDLDAFQLLQNIEKIEHPLTLDSDVYCTLLARLCLKNHVEEAALLAKMMLETGTQPKGLLTDGTMDYLKKSGFSDLVTHLTSLGKPVSCGSAI